MLPCVVAVSWMLASEDTDRESSTIHIFVSIILLFLIRVEFGLLLLVEQGII